MLNWVTTMLTNTEGVHCSPRSSSSRLSLSIWAIVSFMGIALWLGICNSIPVRTDELTVLWSLLCSWFGFGCIMTGMNVELLLVELLSMSTGSPSVWTCLAFCSRFQLCKRFWLMPLSLAILAIDRPEISASCTRNSLNSSLYVLRLGLLVAMLMSIY